MVSIGVNRIKGRCIVGIRIGNSKIVSVREIWISGVSSGGVDVGNDVVFEKGRGSMRVLVGGGNIVGGRERGRGVVGVGREMRVITHVAIIVKGLRRRGMVVLLLVFFVGESVEGSHCCEIWLSPSVN